MEMKYKKYCEVCGKLIPKKLEHWGRYKIKKFCSNRCQTFSLRVSRETGNCIVCGKKFEYKKGQQTGKYCSQKCFHKYYNLKAKKKCGYCGKEILVKRCHLKENNFCSNKCQLKWQNRNKEKIKCKICGKIFYAPKSHHRVTCSEQCNGVLSCMLQANQKGLNKLEKAGSAILRELGIRFNEQVLIEKKFLVDIFMPSKKMVIQWDGEYWHSNPKRKQLDISQDAYMKKCGYRVLRFWERDIRNQPNIVQQKIYETISS